VITAGRRSRASSAAILASLVVAVLLAPLTGHAEDALWQRLQSEPNLVVLMRHGYARGGNPTHWDRSGECDGESRLTPKGRELAERIGAAFREHGIRPVVITSPMCRCRDTAALAFGGTPLSDPTLVETATAGADQIDRFRATAAALLVRHRGAAPVVFVNHRPNIDQLIFDLIEIGDLVVGRIGPDGDIEVLGKFRVST